MTSSLSSHQIEVIIKTLSRARQAIRHPVEELRDLFSENPRLIITPNDRCTRYCLHCAADSNPSGAMMDYDLCSQIDPEFLRIFSVVDFGRRGNPLIYHSRDRDLADLIILLNSHGIDRFTLALPPQKSPIRVLDRLNELTTSRKVTIETMVAYHHYYSDLDRRALALELNSTLRNYSRFSERIIISLLGDRFSQQQPTMAEDVQNAFDNNWGIIFGGFEMSQRPGTNIYQARCGSHEVEIEIPRLDTRVYPIGRFRGYLTQKGVSEQYEKQFEKVMGDHFCPDLIRWPGIIIEPNGSLNLCASFEAIDRKGAIVTNIFTRSYEQVKNDLMQFHRKELDWFLDNIDNIIEGNVSTCKLENGCYQ